MAFANASSAGNGQDDLCTQPFLLECGKCMRYIQIVSTAKGSM